MKRWHWLLPCTLACGAVAQADTLIDASEPDTLVTLLQTHGEAVMDRDAVGDPLIIGQFQGAYYTISFYGCIRGHSCQDLMFNAAWENNGIELATINQWNSNNRYGKAFFDDVGDPTIEMAVNLNWGVSRDNFMDTVEWWFASMQKFSQEIGY
ncbi:YbjN domain-containing protein [Ferrimonas lipolytica]|uniref:YbjN domain-containing protein n=1 Tax=Ferrimonas lipolytica TaxID=2724191 RepID=A0A6H1UA03_9GAMM|nr:YbjN domain-containing protein [Ferrimonas lipolytica]QIZ75459.1 YbjN domain-containing protein [Ferrimonas lipolytica]